MSEGRFGSTDLFRPPMNCQPVLRSATEVDSDQLFEWVNRPDSLSGKAVTSEPILRVTHDNWFAGRLADPGTMIHLIEVDGNPVGQIRLQQDSSGAFAVDIYIEPSHRGQGIAAWSIYQAVSQLRENHDNARLVALVRRENEASQALFQHAGFNEVDSSDILITVEKRA